MLLVRPDVVHSLLRGSSCYTKGLILTSSDSENCLQVATRVNECRKGQNMEPSIITPSQVLIDQDTPLAYMWAGEYFFRPASGRKTT